MDVIVTAGKIVSLDFSALSCVLSDFLGETPKYPILDPRRAFPSTSAVPEPRPWPSEAS